MMGRLYEGFMLPGRFEMHYCRRFGRGVRDTVYVRHLREIRYGALWQSTK